MNVIQGEGKKGEEPGERLENGENQAIGKDQKNGENLAIGESLKNGENLAIGESLKSGGKQAIEKNQEAGKNQKMEESLKNGENLAAGKNVKNGESLKNGKNQKAGKNQKMEESLKNGENQATGKKTAARKSGLYGRCTGVYEGKRHGVQALWALLTNSYLAGFVQGKIYRGSLKNLCVPGLNCYSCPGAVGSCPIGAMQAVIGSWNFKLAFYVAGFLMFVGALMGRFVCGWLCPFGLIQDLLYKVPFFKKIESFRGDKSARKLKYVILVVFVILLPMFLVDILGQGAPYFCKLICPAGTLEGGIPLVLLNKSMRSAVGWLYAWKNVLLAVTVIFSVLIYRPFCKYICPLGAVYSVFNPVSVFRYRVDDEKCTGCGICAKVCKMQVNPVKNANHPECIRCGVCKASCPVKAIR